MRCEQMVTAKQKIIEQYILLLGKNPPSSITIKQIVDGANISRSTFYLHFKDKEDLFFQTKENMIARFLSFYTSQSHNRVTLDLCQHIFKNRNFYTWFFQDASEVYHLTLKLYELLYSVYNDEDYAIFASAGTMGYFTHWIKKDFEISPYKASENLLKIAFSNWTEVLAHNQVKLNESEFQGTQ